MAEEISYVLITPYTIMKSRTGGVIARMLSRTDLDLVGAQMLAPSQEFVDKYAILLKKTVERRNKKIAQLFYDYVKNNFSPRSNGKRQRVMILVYKGRNAHKKLYSIVGHITHKPVKSEKVTGETVRDTYADMVTNRDGEIQYFEPAVLTPPDRAFEKEKIKLIADFVKSESNVVSNIVRETEKGEKTLAIIKPDNWRHPSTKPGNIIDMFSRTGLRIVGCKIHRMSVADALKFYGPVRDVLRKKLAPIIGKKSKELIESEFEIKLDKEDTEKMTKIVGIDYADNEFYKIIEFMSGQRPQKCPENKINAPGLVKCMILIYEGINAVRKIRDVLGPTDPTKAPGGTIRADFGHNIMVNTAHASDSAKSARREMKIVRIDNNELSEILYDYLNKLKK